MALRNLSPIPDDSDSPREPIDALGQPQENEDEDAGPGVVPEGWEGEPGDEDLAQPGGPDGVSRDMATVALNPSVLQNVPAHVVRAGVPGDRSAITDAEIMLRVREGDDSGFNFLIEKYRKPIINFMYRMVHNQAVAEELAQEVFLRVYRSRQTYRAEAK